MTAMQYAEKLIGDKEQEKTIFDDEQRNLIVNFAFKLDDRAATEELVNGLAAALAEDDKEEANRLMYDAQEKIENLPDGMIGLSEMHDYGYRKDDVLPLTKEGAREWHRLGERIYPLFRDGTVGDYVSQEGIESTMAFSALGLTHGMRFCWNNGKIMQRTSMHAQIFS